MSYVCVYVCFNLLPTYIEYIYFNYIHTYIHTYIHQTNKLIILFFSGPVLIAINPFNNIKPDPKCDGILQSFTQKIKQEAVRVQSLSACHGIPLYFCS